jgi:cytochrome P450
MTNTTALQYDPLAPAVQVDPYPFYAALRSEAPVHYLETWQAYAVSRHEDVRRVMHDNVTFSSQAMATLVARPAEYAADSLTDSEDASSFAISIIGTDGDTHTRLRLIVNRAFTPRRVARLEQEIRRIAGAFVDELVEQNVAELQAGLSVPFPRL